MSQLPNVLCMILLMLVLFSGQKPVLDREGLWFACVCFFIDREHPKAQPIVVLSWYQHLRSLLELSSCSVIAEFPVISFNIYA